jgi:hypothetical protein
MTGLGEAWAAVAAFLPKLVGFLLVLLIGYFVAKTVARIIGRVLERVGFNRAVERGGITRVLERTDYDASGILSKLIFYLVMLFVLQLAFGMLGPNPVSDMIQGVVAYLPNVLAAIIIVVVGAAIATAVKGLVASVLGGLSYGRGLSVFAGAAVLVITAFAALDQLRIAPTVVSGIIYALLTVLAGSAIFSFGCGGYPVAREYLQRWAERPAVAASEAAHATAARTDEPAPRSRHREAERVAL